PRRPRLRRRRRHAHAPPARHARAPNLGRAAEGRPPPARRRVSALLASARTVAAYIAQSAPAAPLPFTGEGEGGGMAQDLLLPPPPHPSPASGGGSAPSSQTTG